MTKLWISLGLINLIAAAVIFVDQILRFNVWWEWHELFHHETFTVMLLYAAIFLLIVALVEHVRNTRRARI